MPYTLATNWFFFAIALLLGALFGGWLAKRFCKCDDSALRAEVATLKITHDEHKAKVLALTSDLDAARVKAVAGAADSQKVSGLMGRITELEEAAAAASAAAASAGAATAAARSADATASAALQARVAELEAAAGAASAVHEKELAELRARASAAEAEATAAKAAGSASVSGSATGQVLGFAAAPIAAAPIAAAATAEAAPAVAVEPLDLKAAAQVLGHSVKLDDIATVEGIGPKIKDLFHDAGIATWAQLAETPIRGRRKSSPEAVRASLRPIPPPGPSRPRCSPRENGRRSRR